MASENTPIPDPKEGTDEAIHATALKRFKYCVEFYADTRVSQLDDMRFAAGSPDNGYQWPDAVQTQRTQDPNGPRPCLTINKLPQHIAQVTNDQRQNRPEIKVLPVDGDADVEVADIYNGLIKHIEVSSNADLAYDTSCENQVRCGEGYIRALTDYVDDDSFDQDIQIGRVQDPFSVYMDPDHLPTDPTGGDCEYAFVVTELTKSEFKEQYPNAEAVDFQPSDGTTDIQDWITEDKVRVAEYFYFEKKPKKLTQWPNGEVSEDGEEPPAMAAHNAAMAEAGLDKVKPEKTRTVQVKQLKWCKLNGVEIMKKQDMAGKYLPIVRVVGNEFRIQGEIQISGIVRNAKDAQRMYNYNASMEVELNALAPKAPFIGAAGAFEGFETKWDNANTVNYSYIEYNPVAGEDGRPLPAPQRQAPAFPQTAIMQAKQAADNDIMATTGQYQASLGQHKADQSGVAIKRLQTEGDVGTFHYVDNLSRAIRQLGKIIVDWIPHYYDTRRVARIIGADGTPDHALIDPGQKQAVMVKRDAQGKQIAKIYNPSVGKYDVAVSVGPGYTTKRQEAAAAMTQILQGSPGLMQVIGDLWVKTQDWPGAEEMAERIKRTIPPNVIGQGDDADPEQQLQQAEGVIKQLQGHIQQIEGMAQETIKKADLKKQESALIKAQTDSLRAANDSRELDIEAYDAETRRIAATSAGMSAAQVHELVMGTLHGLMDSGQLQDRAANPQPPAHFILPPGANTPPVATMPPDQPPPAIQGQQ